jgi:ABC-2 type transport system permease protein
MKAIAITKPKLIKLKRSVLKPLNFQNLFRYSIIFFISALVIGGIYSGVLNGLKSAASSPAPPSPESIWGAALFGLSMMLILSSAASALGTLYHAKDMDLLLKAPILRGELYFGKLLEVTFSSCWMLGVFGAPLLAAFVEFYSPPWTTIPIVIGLMIPLLLIYCALGTSLAVVFAALVPAHRTGELLMIVAFIVIVTFGLKGDALFQLMFSTVSAPEQLERIISFIRATNKTWLPSYWAAVGIGDAFLGKTSSAAWLLLSAACAVLSLSYLLFGWLFERGFNLANGGKRRLLASTTNFNRLFQHLPINHTARAIIQKDTVTFLRDLTQALQMILLIGLSLMYLMNFRALGTVQMLGPELRTWWQGVLTIANLGIGAFLVSAVCTRFVFPSISLEGQSFWIVQSSPATIREVLEAKFYLWFLPVSAFATMVLTFGSYAIGATPGGLILTALASLLICYGIVALAVGMGAYFARFDWDHPSELAASFGSLVFILVSILLIAINLVPTGLMLVGREAQTIEGTGRLGALWFYVAAFGAILLAWLNLWIAGKALDIGARALKDKSA